MPPGRTCCGVRAVQNNGLWNPPQAALSLWLDASQVTGIVSGNPLPTWPDLSPSKASVTQTVGANQPLWVDGIRNCKAIVRFNGTNAFYNLPSFLQYSGPRSIYVYGNPTILNQTTPVLGDNTNTDFRVFYQGGGVMFPGWRDPTAAHTGGTYTGGFQSQAWVFGANVGSVYRFQPSDVGAVAQRNAQEAFQFSAAWTPQLTNTAWFLGTESTMTTWLLADIGEILVYTQEHTAAQRQQVWQYLSYKWDRCDGGGTVGRWL